MAAVYEARDTRRGTSCAIKEMSLSTVPANERPQAIQNFLAEARILSRLNHPNLPAFTDFFTEGTRHFLVMEFIDGNTLEELLEGLDPEVFWRAHRSFVVNINRIKEVVPWFKSSYQLRMDDRKQTEIPVSRAQTRRLRELFGL